jgi:hypothetical protein
MSSFEVFKGDHYPDLMRKPEKWCWDAPECSEDCATTRAGEGGTYLHANSQFAKLQ